MTGIQAINTVGAGVGVVGAAASFANEDVVDGIGFSLIAAGNLACLPKGPAALSTLGAVTALAGVALVFAD